MGPTPRLEHAPGGTGPHDPNAPIALRRRSGPGRATRLRFGLALVFLAAATPPLFSYSPGDDRIVGGEFIYTVRRGDSLTAIGARFGVDPLMLARSNGLSPRSRLSVGQSLQVDNRHVVPTAMDEGILINVPQRLLFLFHAGALVAWYPVGLGRPDWETVLGRFAVRTKEREPTWHVPVSIQEEMREHGEPVRTEVAPGPDNPLGKYWMGLTGSACGVHGTIAPASIYGFRTHGCIRLHPDDIADLFPRVVVGTPVWIAYEPVLLVGRRDGSVFLEVNPDAYRRSGDPRADVDALAATEGVSARLDPARIDEVVSAREGIARRIDAIEEIR